MGEEENKFSKDIDAKIKKLMEMSDRIRTTNTEFNEIINTLNNLDVSATNVITAFGEGRTRMMDIKSTIGDAASSVRALGGDISDIVGIQSTLSTTLKRNVILTSDSFKEIYALTQVTGKEAGTLVAGFKDVGISIYQMGDRVNEALAVSQKLGVNAKEVIGSMMNNMEALNKFNFEGGTEGLARMAAHAASLRFNMKETLNLADKVFNPEGAIQVAAAMQRLGVAQSDLLDPLKLMDLAQNDPEELQKQLEGLSRSFVKMKKDGTFEILPGEKRRLQEIENQLGMTQGSLSKLALSSAEVDEKMKRISFGGQFTEEEKRFIASISEIGKGGDMRIRLDGQNLGIGEALSKFKDDPEKLANLMKPKDAIKIAEDQLDNIKLMTASLKSLEERSGLALGGSRVSVEFEEAQRKIVNLIPKFGEGPGVKTEDIRTDVVGIIDKGLSDVLAGKPLTEIFANIGKNFESYTKKLGEDYPKYATDVIKNFDVGSNRILLFADKIGDFSKELKDANFPELSKKMGELINNSIRVEDAVVVKSPADSVKDTPYGALIGTNLNGPTNLGNNTMGTNTESTIKVELIVDDSKSKSFSKEDLKIALNDSTIVNEVKKAVENAMNNFGRSGKTDPLKSNFPRATN